jgi:hypothetical protein
MDPIYLIIISGATAAMIYYSSKKTNDAIDQIEKEMKAFHNRLYALEEKYHQWLMKEKK